MAASIVHCELKPYRSTGNKTHLTQEHASYKRQIQYTFALVKSLQSYIKDKKIQQHPLLHSRFYYELLTLNLNKAAYSSTVKTLQWQFKP